MILYAHHEKIRSLISRAAASAYSDFYKRKYAGANVSPLSELGASEQLRLTESDKKEITDLLESLPFLTRQDITSSHPADRLFVPREEVEFVSYTSGTTDGKPLIQYWGHVDNYFYDPSLGLDIQNILILHPALNKNFGHTFVRQCREAQRPLTPIFADYQSLAQSAVLASATLADAIYTTPTLAEHIADHLDKTYDAGKIKLLVLFSETLTDTKREGLKRRYPNAAIANVYASSEIGQILMYPSREDIMEERRIMRMQTEALVAAELIDGELVITMEQNKAFPLIRYRTGDFFKISQNAQSEDGGPDAANVAICPALEWDGRMDVDKIRVNGMEIKGADIEEALAACRNEIGASYQFHFYSTLSDRTGKEAIRIVVEVCKGSASEFSRRESEEKILQALLTRWHFTSSATLQTAVDKGLALMPEIRFVEALSLQTQKTRHMVSHI